MSSKNSGSGDIVNAEVTPQLFQFDAFQVRAVVSGGEIWFAANDVCAVLDIANHKDAVSRLAEDERLGVGITDPHGRKQLTTVVTEPGLYRLIFTSRKPEAERFKRWVFHDVLPTVRKTGGYNQTKNIPGLATLSRTSLSLLKALKAETNPAARRVVHEQLALTCRLLGIETPPIDTIGRGAPQPSSQLIDFWDAFHHLTGQCGLKLNHAKDPKRIAVNLNEFYGAAESAKRKLPPRNEMVRVLKDSQSPRFLENNWPVRSAHSDRIIRCWLFSTEEAPA